MPQWALEACLVPGAQKVQTEGRCRMCQRPARVRQLTRHHLVPQAFFRGRGWIRRLRDCGPNVVPLCRPCHDRVDNRGQDAERRDARRELRHALTQAEVAFVIAVRGERWLEREYPLRSSTRATPRRAVAA